MSELHVPAKRWRQLPNGELWNNAAWKEARKRVIASKDPYCAICHKYIDVELAAYEPMACEIDHIIPISRGGPPYDVDNLQMSHSRCNRQKGARMRSDYEGLENQNICPVSNKW